MFDIGFWELALIGVVALLVVGPERLPGLARTTGLYVRKVRRFVASVRSDIEQELRAEELKRLLDEGRQFQDLGQSLEQTRTTLAEAQRDLSASALDEKPSPATAPSQPRTPTPPSNAAQEDTAASGAKRGAPDANAGEALERGNSTASTASIANATSDPNRTHGG